MDITKQIGYWKLGSIEKILKAHVVRKTGEMPPRIHNLVRLAELAGITLDSRRADLLRRFNLFQLEGRYPGTGGVPLDEASARQRLLSAKEAVEWLTKML